MGKFKDGENVVLFGVYHASANEVVVEYDDSEEENGVDPRFAWRIDSDYAVTAVKDLSEVFKPVKYGVCKHSEHGSGRHGWVYNDGLHERRNGCEDWQAAFIIIPQEHVHELFEEGTLIRCKGCKTTWGVTNG